MFGNSISDALFLAAIDKSIYEYLGIDYTIVEKCILLNATFGALKLLIHQYNEIAIECVAAILECINRMNDLFDFVKKIEPIEEFEMLVQNANGALAILQPYLVKENEKSAS
ncbi:MAG: hypothetical protein JJE03_07260 [Peptostreptococcaceae bacterium]|nr:hypothetical protein [Peptostreptococcaceae bacterium]